MASHRTLFSGSRRLHYYDNGHQQSWGATDASRRLNSVRPCEGSFTTGSRYSTMSKSRSMLSPLWAADALTVSRARWA